MADARVARVARAGARDQLRRLVAVPSIAGGENHALIAEIASALDDAGAAVTLVPGTRPGVELLHAVLGPTDAPGGILLAAHGDVVDVAGQAWTSDPFALRDDGGRLYGRGTTDMKGFIAAVLSAGGAVPGSRLRSPLHVAISHDEELGCAGVGPLLETLGGGGGLRAPLAGVVVGEPTGLRVIDRHKGKAAFRLTIGGRAAHSATPAAGVNAVRAAARVIVALEGLERELADELTDDAFTTPRATIGIGPIAGGVSLNIVPDRCTVELEARVLPGQDLGAVQARVREVAVRSAGRDVTLDLTRVAGYPPLCADPSGAAFAQRVGQAAGDRGPLTPGAVDFGTEAGLYQERLGVPVLVCGPGSMAQGHTPDEFIEAEQLAAGETFVAGLIESLRRARA